MANTDLFNFSGGVATPNSPYQGGRLSPAIRNMAQQNAQEGFKQVTGFLGQRGLNKSSFLPNLMSKTYQSAFSRAMGDFNQAQQTQMPWATALLQGKMAQGAEPAKQSWWQRALVAGGTGALAGGQIGGPKGAAIGGGIGLLSTLGGQ